MLIVCPSCATSYDVEPASLGAGGRQVRCVRCRTVWRAELSRAAQLAAAAEALAPGAPAFPSPLAAASVANVEMAAAAAGDVVQADTFPDVAPDEQPDPVAAQGPAQVSAQGLPEALAGVGDPDPADISATPEAETVEVEAPPLAPVDLDAGRPPIEIDADGNGVRANEPADDIETVAARRAKGGRRRLQFPSLSRLHALILGLLIADAILIGWRTDVVRLLPQTASLYAHIGMPVNLRGLDLDDLATATETHDGVPILVVRGKIVNVTGAITEVPRLKLVVRDAAKREIYSWTVAPPVARLLPHQATDFSSRLASPPAGSKDVMARFLNRRDLMAVGG
ncbi:MAG: zinc-ribbon domain-containing protein [Xanthobacteraceae bacterium]